MLNGFHSVVVDVEDFESAVADYAVLLGREPCWRGSQAARGSRCALFSLSNMMLEIRDPGTSEESGLSGPDAEGSGEGLRGIRLIAGEAPDLEAVLLRRGVSTKGWTKEPWESDGVAARREGSRLLLDPESSRGIDIELVRDESAERGLEASARAGSPAMISSLDHVVVFSADIEATRSFYLDGLGLRLALDKTFEERKVRLLFFRLGGTTIEIGSRLGAEPDPSAQDRFGGLAWQVVDVDAIRKRLLAEKFDVSEVRKGNKDGTRVCTVRSPVHGVPTLLIQPVSG